MSASSRGDSISRRHLLVLASSSVALGACGGVAPAADGGGDDSAMAGNDVTGTLDGAVDSAIETDVGVDAISAACAGMGNPVGPVGDFAAGTWTLFTRLRVIVGRDANGLFAYSAVCTHEGCLVDAPDATGEAVCPCHFSRFDGNGGVISGRASLPLGHYAVNVCEGVVFVNRTMRVDAATRTAV